MTTQRLNGRPIEDIVAEHEARLNDHGTTFAALVPALDAIADRLKKLDSIERILVEIRDKY